MNRRAKGEGSVHKRTDGRWVAIVDMGWDAGGRLRKYVYGKTRKEVVDKLRDAARSYEEGVLIKNERLTVRTFFDRWIASKKLSLRASTWKRYNGIIELHVKPNIGPVQLNRLEPNHLQKLYSRLIDDGLSPASVLYLHRVLHVALQDAVKWGLASRNVASVVTPPRAVRNHTRTLSSDEAQSLLSAANGDRLEALYVLALTTGMRQGELLGLMWSDVNLKGAYLVIQHSLQISAKGGHEIGPPKTAKSRRRVLLHKRTIEALHAHRSRQEVEIQDAMGSWSNMGLVFPNNVGKPISPTNLIRRSFYPLLKRGQLPQIRFHDLRHTAATLLLGEGVHPKIVSEMLGHSQIGITLDLYSHVTDTMMQGAVDAFDNILGAERQPQ